MVWKKLSNKVMLAKLAFPLALFVSVTMAMAPSSVFAAPAPTFAAAATVTCPTAGHPNGNGTQCLVNSYINPLINTVSALVGIITVISIVIAGIQYTTSADDPSKVQAAKTRITRSLFAFLMFIFLYAILQWVVPGGLLNS